MPLRRKIIRVGSSRAVTLPQDWLGWVEERFGVVPREVEVEVRGEEISLRPVTRDAELILSAVKRCGEEGVAYEDLLERCSEETCTKRDLLIEYIRELVKRGRIRVVEGRLVAREYVEKECEQPPLRAEGSVDKV
jgi:antitoxin component of MazEF toxin-antitoxin module